LRKIFKIHCKLENIMSLVGLKKNVVLLNIIN